MTRLVADRSVLLATLTLLLPWLGCAAPLGPPLDPDHQLRRLAERTSQPLVPESTDAASASPTWFSTCREVRFDDALDLAEANTLALFYSPEVVSARREERVQGALLTQAGLPGNPTLFAGPRLSTVDSVWIVPLSIFQPIALGGRLEAEEDRARADVEMARARVLQVEIETLAEVRREFIRGAVLRREIVTLDALIRDSERVADWVDARFAASESDAVSVFTARAALLDVRWELWSRRSELSDLGRRLKNRLGLLADARVEFTFGAEALSVPELPSMDPELLLCLPQLQASEAEYRAAAAALREELAGRWPDLAVGPQFESIATDPSVGIGLSLELPLFDQNDGNILAARERLLGAAEAYRAALLGARLDQADARAALAVALGRLDELEGVLPYAASARAALTAKLERGEADLLQVVLAANAWLRLELRKNAARQQAAIARVDVLVASGWLAEISWPGSPPDGSSPDGSSLDGGTSGGASPQPRKETRHDLP